MVTSLKGENFKALQFEHLVQQADYMDVVDLSMIVKEFLQKENIWTFEARVQGFVLAKSNRTRVFSHIPIASLR
jgi:hypothetical protein